MFNVLRGYETNQLPIRTKAASAMVEGTVVHATGVDSDNFVTVDVDAGYVAGSVADFSFVVSKLPLLSHEDESSAIAAGEEVRLWMLNGMLLKTSNVSAAVLSASVGAEVGILAITGEWEVIASAHGDVEADKLKGILLGVSNGSAIILCL